MHASATRGSSAHRLINVVLGVAVVIPVVAVWSVTFRTLIAREAPHVAPGRPQAVAWGNRVFSSQAELRRWLKGRGIDYDNWAKHHAAAAAIVEHRPRPRLTVPVSQHPTASSKGVKRSQSRGHAAVRAVKPTHRPAPTHSRSPQTERLDARSPAAEIRLGVWALVAVLAAIALAPRRWAMGVGRGVGTFRWYAATAALAIAVGTVAAQMAP